MTLTTTGAAVDDTSLPAAVTLADLRKAAGLSQSEVAKRMGVNQPRVSQIEADYPNLHFTVVSSYMEALGGHIALTGVAGRTVPATDVRPTHRNPDAALKRRRLQRKGVARMNAEAAFTQLPAEELVLQGDQPEPGGDDTGRNVDHPDAESDQGDGGHRQQR